MAPQNVQLVMRTGPNPGKLFAITKDEMIIGRDATCDIVINDAEISRRHARLVNSGGGIMLEDLGSTNGTFVNGQRLMGPHSLRSGELVMLGENVSLSYEAAEFDPGATMMSGSMGAGAQSTMVEPSPEPYLPPAPPPQAFGAPPQPPQPEPQAYQPQPQAYQPMPLPPSPPAYVGQVPAGPMPVQVEMPPAPQKKSGGNRTWLFAGCGCLLIILCLVLVGAIYYIDANKLWCSILPFLAGCK